MCLDSQKVKIPSNHTVCIALSAILSNTHTHLCMYFCQICTKKKKNLPFRDLLKRLLLLFLFPVYEY